MNRIYVSSMSAAESPALANLLFSFFIHVTDADRNVAPQDVRRFLGLLKDRRWTESEELDLAAAELAQNYSSYWTSYAQAGSDHDIDAIASALASVEQALSPDRTGALRRSLAVFLNQLERGSPGTGLLGSAAQSGNRVRARESLLALLADEHETMPRPPSVAARMTGEPSQTGAGWPAAALGLDSGHVWAGGRTRVRCTRVVPETHDTKTYTFTATPLCLFQFKPGQAVTLELPIEGRVLRRSYTISSSPSRPYSLSVTVKRVPKGWVSNWLYENMAEGFELDISGPAGGFTCVDHPAPQLLFLAGGSGVTPIMSMLRWIADTGTRADMVFINNVRTPEDIIFHQELLHLAGHLGPSLKLAIIPARVPAGQIWNGLTGRFDAALLQNFAPDFAAREIFACGPAGYMANIRKVLEGLGHPMIRYHEESFGGTAPRKPAAAAAGSIALPPRSAMALVPPMAPHAFSAGNAEDVVPPLPRTVSPRAATVTLAPTGENFPALPGQTILEAAEARGIQLDHSCRSGTCGTCRMRCTTGKASMPDQDLLDARELADGYVLTCIASPMGNITLEG